jgi:hypothetical protein
LASPKKEPDAANCDHVSPTILLPDGTVTVRVRMYVPASMCKTLPTAEFSAL